MSKQFRKRKTELDVPEKRLREKFTELLELPKELVLDLPKITLIGNSDMMIENYKSIMEYGKERIRLKTGMGTVMVSGVALMIKEISSEDVILSGDILKVEFTK